MLAAKAIRVASELKRKGMRVVLGVDGYRGVLNSEWHLMQLLGQGAK